MKSAYSRDIILLTYDFEGPIVDEVYKLIVEQERIPPSLITKKQVDSPCLENKKVIVHLCIEKEKMKLVSIDKTFATESLSVFRNKL